MDLNKTDFRKGMVIIMEYDVLIIGAGPAGLGAAIYAVRAGLKLAVIEKSPISGGQVLTTYEVDNYLGLPGINGSELSGKFREHADRLQVPFIEEEVTEIQECEGSNRKKVITDQGEYITKTVVLATGAKHAKLLVPGEEELTGMGVSYCATCDGAFFRNREVAVIGGGDVAVEDAVFLAGLCKKVYVVHRRNQLRAAKRLQDKLLAMPNVEMCWNTTVESIDGTDMVESITVKNTETQKSHKIFINGVFIAVGIHPETDRFQSIVATDEAGYIKASEDCETLCPGIFAAGDIRRKPLRQIITAVSDGANAINAVQNYVNML